MITSVSVSGCGGGSAGAGRACVERPRRSKKIANPRRKKLLSDFFACLTVFDLDNYIYVSSCLSARLTTRCALPILHFLVLLTLSSYLHRVLQVPSRSMPRTLLRPSCSRPWRRASLTRPLRRRPEESLAWCGSVLRSLGWL